MIPLRRQVIGQLSRFDEDAWIAVANRGLLRRATKDLAALDVRFDPAGVNDETAQEVRVLVDDRIVTFTAAGPAAARCTCPSTTLCQHILTAGLWLASQANADGASEAATDVQLHDELMALDLAALTAHAGKPGHRWATQFVADLDLAADVTIGTGRHTTIAFARPPVTFHYPGGGVAALTADERLPQLARYQVAAVLAYQLVHGATPAAHPEPSRPARGTTGPLADSRAMVRAGVTRLLGDTVRLGISHLSPTIQERYASLATTAQGAEYHRLARLLRRMADDVDLLTVRSARADEHRLLADAALVNALVGALAAAEQRGTAPPRLVGQARARYEPVRSMELIGLGGHEWRSQSGYAGLTALFWEPRAGAFRSWTDARPVTLRGFSPRTRWTQFGPWAGLSSPAATVGQRVTLTDAALGAAGRISGIERTSAALTPIPVNELIAALPVQTSWTELADRFDPARRSLLDEAEPLRNWVVLRPDAFLPARFDQVRQVMTWDLLDAEGHVLGCRIPYAESSRHLIGRLEDLTAADTSAGTLVVVRLRASGGSLIGDPLSLIRPDGAAASGVDILAFDPAPSTQAGGRGARLLEALRLRSRPSDIRETPEAAPVLDLPAALVALRATLEAHAERGVGSAPPDRLLGEIGERHRALRDIGFSIFPDPVPGTDPAQLLLRSHYLLQQVTAALTGEATG